jgi:putative ABC transport system permease protein
MTLALRYNLSSLAARWRSAVGAAVGIALTVAVFILVLALAGGLRATYLNTGDSRNLLVLRKGALAESSSQITPEEAQQVTVLDGIGRDAQGRPLASAEVIVLATLSRASGGRAHVQVRGVGPAGGQLRPEVRIVEGRMFQPGVRECIASRSIARRFASCGLGQTFGSGKHTWKVVGLFDARHSAYDSEVWVDAEEAREAFNRSFYGSVSLRPTNDAAAASLIQRIADDRQMRLRALTEADYYREQTRTAGPIQMFGLCLALVMGLGAIFSAANTMYAAVDARTQEIGVLRALGFTRSSICLAFTLEAVAVALAGGVLGCLLCLPLHDLATGTFNWRSFAEVAFEFRITGGLMTAGIVFAVVMGLLGGLLPALLAARMRPTEALAGK